MKVMVITGSPNKNGLTAACGEQAGLGAAHAGAEVYHVRLNDMNIGLCHACSGGWGTCRDEHYCQVQDDFQDLHATLKEMDGFVIVTPVYWGDMSESTKAFLDRLRRCEAFKKSGSFLSGKPFIIVAAAGGSGNGVMSCLSSMERFVDHNKGVKFDNLGVTRRNKEHKLKAIFESTKTMTEGIKESR
ncbi:putative NAD(P)H-dependent FMN-containing oxidoreductase YwqN [Oxobacter pfennigii]|uniref:Putative NAD(P)H-dependent FMN-containing oxidoreductase YwqN n=1 Tax=Oxobacter pfennigii TaxID=36849 RepID=A0A0P8WCH2_9CLOT|nr:flavodoxin family protein [Oxobacter pfennigii]KPU45430.1 putative NAD(P)H-dependent FMN-containing oxidoreductase YwqN [Oxobacter pfennigii]